ncbi:MAG: CHAT domain-containing protein [Chitinophagales bacterium]|nr:CHAT domain-containing protein [Chitinophagales bacterium]
MSVIIGCNKKPNDHIATNIANVPTNDTTKDIVLILKSKLENWQVDSFELMTKRFYRDALIKTTDYNNILGSYFLAKGMFDSLRLIIHHIEKNETLTLSENNLLARYYLEENEYDKSKQYFIAALNQSKEKSCSNKQRIILYINYGSFYYYYSDLDSAAIWYEKANRLIKKSNLTYSVINALYLYNIGALQGEYANYSTKEKYLLQSKHILDSLNLKNHPLQAKIYGSMAGLKISTDDYNDAINYSLKDIDNIEQNFGTNNYELYYSYSNLGVIYRQLKDFKKAEYYLIKAKNIAQENFGAIHENIVDALIELSTIYYLDNKNGIALATIDKAITIETTINNKSIVISNANSLKAEILLKENQFHKSKLLLYNCINNFNNYYGDRNPYSANCYTKLSQLSLQQNQLDSSYFFINKAIEKTTQKDSIIYAYDYWTTIEQLCNIISTSKDSSKYSETLLQKIDNAIAIANSLRFNYYGYFTKAAITEKMDNLYKTAYDCTYSLYNKTKNNKYILKALDYSTQSKYALLNSKMKKTYLKAKLPKSVSQQLDYLSASIKTWQELIESSGDDNEIQQYQKKLSAAEYKVHKIENKYIKIEHQFNKELLQQLQAHLNKQSAFIDYYFTQNKLYQITIENKQLLFKEIADSKTIKEKIKQLKQSITNKQYNNYLAYSLYKNLAPKKTYANIIFCTHEDLATIPFEALKVNPKKDIHNFYLYHANINYCYSIYHYNNKNKHQFITSGNIVQPNYTSKKLQLNYASSEARSIQQKFIKNKIINNYNDLKQELCKAKLLHFIAHTYQNSKQELESGIIFESDNTNKIFKTKDFLTYATQADVAILASCQTNFGKAIKAEGNLNLVYGLEYTGVNQVVYSLWNLNDKSTQNIITNFYKNWTLKKSIATSLQQAKKDYLAQADAMACQPYFWAGITQQSNYQKLFILNKHNITTCIIITILLLLSIALLIYKQ